MPLTKAQFLKELDDQLEEGIAMCGSYDPATNGEIRELRKEIKRRVMWLVRNVPSPQLTASTKLQDVWATFLEADDATPEEKDKMRGLGTRRTVTTP